MAVYAANLIIDRGTDFECEFGLNDNDGLNFNLTNYRVFSKIRKHRESENFISFNTSIISRTQGIIKLSLPRWVSAKLKPGRYVYDVIVVDFNNLKTIVLEGDILVQGLISQNCNFILPTSAQRLCIAVIDENDSNSVVQMETLWSQFRAQYPNRPFYLLMPTNAGFGNVVGDTQYDTLRCPDNFLNETTINTPPLI
jgi:hypothetical protein